MGILNVTPDSFSDGGKYFSQETAFQHALKLYDEGADIIDVGGESTRPGAELVSDQVELDRVIPVIEKILKENKEIVLSIDTTKSSVAEEAILAGARIINDVSAGAFDQKMYDVAARNDVPFVIMHIKGNPQNMQNSPFYSDLTAEICDYFKQKIELAKISNVNKIILDPGIGFGKRVNDNYEIISKLENFKLFNFPILIGLSKKSFIGKSLNLDINERENATIIAEAISVIKGASIIRTHNVINAVELKSIYSFLNKETMQISV